MKLSFFVTLFGSGVKPLGCFNRISFDVASSHVQETQVALSLWQVFLGCLAYPTKRCLHVLGRTTPGRKHERQVVLRLGQTQLRRLAEPLEGLRVVTHASASGRVARTEKKCGARIAAIGYCFGGGAVLHAARIGMPLAGVVSYHGALASRHTPAPGSVRARILVCHGAEDVLVPEEHVTALHDEMKAAGADLRFIAYPGALHGFTNPEADVNGKKYGLPLAYHEETDRLSWQETQSFFKEIFA